MKQPENLLLLVWLLLTGLVAFGAVVCTDQGLIQAMIVADQSRICIVLIVMYLAGLAHTLIRTLYLSRQLDLASQVQSMLGANPGEPLHISGRRLTLASGVTLPSGFLTDYLVDVASAASPPPGTGHEAAPANDLLDAYASRIRGAHDFGWFYIDLMLKVGFLGTLVGFILMLGSVADTSSLDATTMQKVLTQMSYGMSTALYTTLASLVGGILLAVPYQLLERGLNRLLEITIYIKEVSAANRPRPS
jgi:hypothetical protein